MSLELRLNMPVGSGIYCASEKFSKDTHNYYLYVTQLTSQERDKFRELLRTVTSKYSETAFRKLEVCDVFIIFPLYLKFQYYTFTLTALCFLKQSAFVWNWFCYWSNIKGINIVSH